MWERRVIGCAWRGICMLVVSDVEAQHLGLVPEGQNAKSEGVGRDGVGAMRRRCCVWRLAAASGGAAGLLCGEQQSGRSLEA